MRNNKSDLQIEKKNVLDINKVNQDLVKENHRLLEMNESLMISSEKLKMVGQLAGGIAHEIRNPLTAIKGFLKLIQQGNMDEDKKNIYFEILDDELMKIDQIAGELLILAKPHSVTYRDVNLSKLMMDVITLLNTHAVTKNIELIYEGYKGNVIVRCDEIKIKQVFINIIKNAIESMRNGIVNISTDILDSHVKVKISDQGKGIPHHVLHRMGEPFFTTKDQGTGLGIVICNRILETHQGKMFIESKEGIGTTIIVMLPMMRS